MVGIITSIYNIFNLLVDLSLTSILLKIGMPIIRIRSNPSEENLVSANDNINTIDANKIQIVALIVFLFSDFVDIRNKDNPATEYGAIFPSG